MPWDESHVGKPWIARIAIALSIGAAATGVIRAMDQLLPGLDGALWGPSYAINALAARVLGWPSTATVEMSFGVWVQEGGILLVTAAAVLWSLRRLEQRPFSALGVGVISLGPWLTNAEAAVVVMMGKPQFYGLVLLLFLLTSCVAAITSWWLARRGLRYVASAALVLGFLAMLIGLYWLNPLTAWMIQAVALSSCVVLTLIFITGRPADVVPFGEDRR
jgi:hypothetical protein